MEANDEASVRPRKMSIRTIRRMVDQNWVMVEVPVGREQRAEEKQSQDHKGREAMVLSVSHVRAKVAST